MADIFGTLPCIVLPSVGGQIPYITKDQHRHHCPHAIGADDIVEVMPALIKSGAKNLAEFMFRKKWDSASILVPHEILRFHDRYTEAKKSNDIRAGGATMKEAPLWAPSGKNLTTPEFYMKITNAVQPNVVQLLSDYDIDYRSSISKKRYEKSIKRSENWIEQQLKIGTTALKLVPIMCHPDDKIYGNTLIVTIIQK